MAFHQDLASSGYDGNSRLSFTTNPSATQRESLITQPPVSCGYPVILIELRRNAVNTKCLSFQYLTFLV